MEVGKFDEKIETLLREKITQTAQIQSENISMCERVEEKIVGIIKYNDGRIEKRTL